MTKKGDQKKYAIWYYKERMREAKKILDNEPFPSDPEIVINPTRTGRDGLVFNKSGDRIFYYVSKKITKAYEEKPVSAIGVKVDVWDYRSDELPETPRPPTLINSQDKQYNEGGLIYQFDIATENSSLVDSERNVIYWYNGYLYGRTDYVVTRHGRNAEPWKGEKPKYFLISLKDGSKEQMDTAYSFFKFSPSERFLLCMYYDGTQNQFSIYDIASKVMRPINGVTEELKWILGWTTDNQSVVLYDKYSDMWLCDLSGKKSAVNITHGYGKKNNIRFELLGNEEEEGHIKLIDPSKKQFLAVLEARTKRNGFYSLDVARNEDPRLLSMDNCVYFRSQGGFGDFGNGAVPEVSGNGNSWVVTRQTESEAPNYYVTKDFKHFRQISNLQPQKKYNWLTTELVNWNMNDGKEAMGVLYKPEDFNPAKKYPVIFYYYEEMSNALHDFRTPGLAHGPIDIPWLVSRGYLVFTPDIKYEIDSPGAYALKYVVSAAENLKKLPYVDGTRLGLQGHSFGGFETNYIVTHSNLFAAAQEGAGVSDLISKYGGIVDGKAGNDIHYYEAGQGRMSRTKSLWQNKEAYIRESPIFNADKINTPLLMMHNKKDNAVPWTQGVELFTALWRLQKPAWMLQYDNDDHGIYSDNAFDYTMRITQFFDHYLKGKPAPKWMTEPGYHDNGDPYALDSGGKQP